MKKHEIHPQAVVAASAKLGEGVKIGAYAVIGEDVELGDGCVLHAHATVGGPSKFGKNNTFYPFSAIGGDPQDYTFRGERTELVVGVGNIFREYVTVSRGTQKGGGKTSLGDGNFFLAYSHVGHDCSIGCHTLFVNGATLAGHVTVEDFVTIGALHRRIDGDYTGCPAVFENRHRARDEKFWHQYNWPGAQGIFARAFAGLETGLSFALALKVEYLAGACRNAEIAGRFRRRTGIDQIHRERRTRHREVTPD